MLYCLLTFPQELGCPAAWACMLCAFEPKEQRVGPIMYSHDSCIVRSTVQYRYETCTERELYELQPSSSLRGLPTFSSVQL
jgi:hypothetical protein